MDLCCAMQDPLATWPWSIQKGGPIHPEIRLCVKGTLDSTELIQKWNIKISVFLC